MPLETPPHMATARVEAAHYANTCGGYTHLHRESVSTLLAYDKPMVVSTYQKVPIK